MTKRKHKSEAPKGFNQSLGRSLINRSKGLAKERRQQNNPNQIAGPTSANDALKSITHETDLEEFFCNAELSNANFEATKNDIRLIQSNNTAAIPIEHFENRTIDQLYAKYGELLKIPRRPKQGTFKNANELDALESAEFLEWRRKLAKLSEGSGVVITPFERNLEIWRQLWRVLERSHVVVQDCSRAARIILLDFVKCDPIKWCAAPPDIPQKQFDYWTFQSLQISSQKSNSNSIVGATLLSQLEKRNLLLI